MNLLQAKKYGVISFHTTQAAIEAEKCLECSEINFFLIPLPTGISASCGLALKFFCKDGHRIQDLLAQAGIKPSGVYYVVKEGSKSIIIPMDQGE